MTVAFESLKTLAAFFSSQHFGTYFVLVCNCSSLQTVRYTGPTGYVSDLIDLRTWRTSLAEKKVKFYRAFNSFFRKIGRIVSKRLYLR